MIDDLSRVVSNLSREDKKKLVWAFKEQERLKRENGIDYYIPLADSEPFHKCQSRYRLVSGGNRSSKTYSSLADLVWIIFGKHPWITIDGPGIAWIASDSHEKNRDVIWPILQKLIPKNQIAKVMFGPRKTLARIDLNNGWTISIKSYEAGRESFQGAEVHIILLDEEPPEDIWTECKMRGLTCKGLIILAMTAVNGITWVYHRLWRPAMMGDGAKFSVSCFSFDTDKNPYIPDEEKARIREGLTQEEIDVRIKGKFLHKSGLVYTAFIREKHVIEDKEITPLMTRALHFYEGADPGQRVAFAVIFAYMDPAGNVVVYDEHYVKGMPLGFHKEQINSKRREWNVTRPRWTAIDPAAGICPVGATLSVQTQLALEPFPIYTTLSDNTKESGRWRVMDYLRFNKLYIMKKCKNLIWEFENFTWAETNPNNEDDRTIKANNHALDALRYLLMTMPSPMPQAVERKEGTFDDYMERTEHLEKFSALEKRLERIAWNPNAVH
jgi:phage terminase large subunit-like protein